MMRAASPGATVVAVRSLNLLVGRMRRVDPLAADAVVAVLLGGVGIATAATARHPSALTVLAAAAIAATVVWRRRVPTAAIVVAAAGYAVYTRSGGDTNAIVEPAAILLDYYALGRRSGERGAAPWDAVLLALAVASIAVGPGSGTVADIAWSWALAVGLPFVAGRELGRRSILTRGLQADAERLEREQEERARRAGAEERNRVARELHDIVAHSVSVMVIQTAAARRVAGRDRQAAHDALRSVERCGRDALVEMRRMIGVLRRDDAELAGAMSPGLSQLDALAARARVAGLPVELRVDGEHCQLSPGMDLVAFRVVQEALTNTIKHAGPARAHVHLTFTTRELELNVWDTGRGPAIAEPSTGIVGHGLLGMRERLVLYGGELHTGRRAEGGFQLQARLPLDVRAGA